MATIILSASGSHTESNSTTSSTPLYCCYHPENTAVFEDFCGDERFEIINALDEASPTQLSTSESILQLINEIMRLTQLPIYQQHPSLHHHLLEVLVLCKLCVWDPGRYILTLSPFGYNKAVYPAALPAEIRFSLLDLSLASPQANTPNTQSNFVPSNDTHLRIVKEVPWVYTLYRDAFEQYTLRVYYSPKSYVDAQMDILLSATEISLFEQDPHWLECFAKTVSKAPQHYRDRAI